MKMVKRLLLLLVIILVIAVGAGIYFKDTLLKKGIEEGGSYALGTPTQLQKASLKPFAGQLNLDNLAVNNPSGFSSTPFFKMQNAAIQVNTKSLLQDVVTIDKLHFQGIHLQIERKGASTNLQQILNHLKGLSSQEAKTSGEAPAGEGKTGKKFIVNQLLIQNTQATLQLGAGQTLNFKLPKVELQKIGTAEGGLSFARLTQAILQSLLQSLQANQGLPLQVDQLLKQNLQKLPDIKGLEQKLDKEVQKRMQDLSQKAQKKLEETVGGSQQDLQKQLDEQINKQKDNLLKGLQDKINPSQDNQ